MLELKNKVYRGKQPAVLLVHDFNATPSQMVPLVAPLHEQGYEVMVVGLRGVGRGRVAAQTFGLNESVDVRAPWPSCASGTSVDARPRGDRAASAAAPTRRSSPRRRSRASGRWC